MLAKRIIPCLDVTGGRVVKGVNFVELRDAGDPVEIAARYNEQGADELTFLDITATSDERDVILHIIEAVASQVFIPLTVGGGVRRPPFLSDLSVHARGHAFLTASSADEAAQESDRIQGGFFTHYFLSGLRGAADTSRDGRVTLAEAYQFSYGETLRRTEL